ncbi:MAG: hypothetical protein ACE5F1_03850 [Planctomycetota bacterium]
MSVEARDGAIVKAMRYLDKEIWKLQELGSPRRQFTMAVMGWAYLLAADKPKDGGKKLPSRKKQLVRLRKELLRYAESVARLYERADKKSRKKKKKRQPKPGLQPGFPSDFNAFRAAQYTWPLSIAAQFFTESAARGKQRGQAREALKAIVRVLEASQQPDGGWGHDDAARPGMGLPPIRIPKPGGGKHEYPGTLLAASHCALSGLGVAKRSLKSRKQKSLELGRAYFKQSQNGDGTFPYDPAQKHDAGIRGGMAGGIEAARASGAAFALFCAGASRDDPVACRALDAVDRSPELLSEGHGSATLALMFGALLSRARGKETWNVFRRIYLPRILAEQEENGAFTCVCKHASPGVTCDTRPIPGMPGAASYAEQQKVYVTAIHTLILLLDRAEARALPEMPSPRGPSSGK